MWTPAEIALQQQSPSFQREYNLKFLGNVGNIFHYADIDGAITASYSLDESNPYAIRFMGIDPAFGSSQFGICIIQFNNGAIEVLYADSWERSLFDIAIQNILDLMQRYHICKLLCDGANPSIIKALKHKIGSSEFINYDLIDSKEQERVTDSWITGDCEFNKVVPISFRSKHKPMLEKLMKLLSKRRIRIDRSFNKLILSLRTATGNQDDFTLDKTQTSYSDCLDALRLATYPIQFYND
jgi:hypothetical protein